MRPEAVDDDRCEPGGVDRLALRFFSASVEPGEEKQLFDNPVHAPQFLDAETDPLFVMALLPWLPDQDFQCADNGRERGFQLMRGIRVELLFPFVRAAKPVEEIVDGSRETKQLVAPFRKQHPLVEIRAGDVFSGIDNPFDRFDAFFRDEPCGEEKHEEGQRQGDEEHHVKVAEQKKRFPQRHGDENVTGQPVCIVEKGRLHLPDRIRAHGRRKIPHGDQAGSIGEGVAVKVEGLPDDFGSRVRGDRLRELGIEIERDM